MIHVFVFAITVEVQAAKFDKVLFIKVFCRKTEKPSFVTT